MNAWLIVAAGLSVLTAGAHSVLGERRILAAALVALGA